MNTLRPRARSWPIRWWAWAMVASLLVGLASSGIAWARHHSRAGGARAEGVAGQFDYYMLSLSWSPAFCLNQPGSTECHGPRRLGFVVHGLWPQYERGWPEHCGNEPLPPTLAEGMLDLMPALRLVEHEWSTHGTCSGLGPADYFALVRRAHDEVAIPSELGSPSAAIEQSPSVIIDEFIHANPKLMPDSVTVTCSGQGAPRLKEVEVCFDRDLAPRACAPDVLRRACRAISVIVPPVR